MRVINTNKMIIIQFLRYSCVGGLASISEWILFYLFNSIFGFHYLFAVFLSYTIATLENYIISVIYVFDKSTYSYKKEISLIFLISIVGLLLNFIFMIIFINLFAIDNILAKIIATAIVLFWNFTARKYFIYK